MDYRLLLDEIAQPAYAGMSDGEIVAALNASSMARRRVAIGDLQARAMETGVYTALRVASGDPAAPADLRTGPAPGRAWSAPRLADVDLDNAASVQMFGVLVRAGVISPQQAEAIDALATVQLSSWAQQHLGVDVTEDDIAVARDWQAAQVAEAERLAAYAALRERLVNGYHGGLAWLQAQQDGGQAAPEWAAVVARM